MERNRQWHDPVVEIFSSMITPGVCCSADAYDLANRRWYRLDIDSIVEDEDWLSSTVAKHIAEYYLAHKEAPPWNTIKTTASGSPVTFETEPDDLVGRPINESLSYGSEPTDLLPTTTVDELENLRYISRAADRCTWHGKDCVFKRIEFNIDIRGITKEIRKRESLIKSMQMDHFSKDKMEDVNLELTNRFLIVPVHAVVLAQAAPWKPGTVAGLLMPFAGRDLEMWARDEGSLPIAERHIRDIIRGVRDLGKAGVQHGDIKYWNAVFRPTPEPRAELLLIDLGSLAPDYDGDAKALRALLLWCLEQKSALGEDGPVKARVQAAAEALAEEDFDAALKVLLP